MTAHLAAKALLNRYVIGRDGVFATLWDQWEKRLIVGNASEKHCRRVRDQLIGQQAEQRHIADPMDSVFARLACAHTGHCSCPENRSEEIYADWTADLRARIEAERNAS